VNADGLARLIHTPSQANRVFARSRSSKRCSGRHADDPLNAPRILVETVDISSNLPKREPRDDREHASRERERELGNEFQTRTLLKAVERNCS
jgi:hypothetical protein